MKNLNVKDALISSMIVYVLGITAYAGSFFVPLMENQELQANLVLMVAIVPSVMLGTHLYYRRGNSSNSLSLGLLMFLIAIILDAIITVPLFIMPHGGNHLSFFGDPGFWLIGFEYVSLVILSKKIRQHRVIST